MSLLVTFYGVSPSTQPREPLVGKLEASKFSEADLKCAADNAHYEAASERPLGMYAVTAVVINRSRDSRWPETICGVVYQKNQFSWTKRKGAKLSRLPSEEAVVSAASALADSRTPWPTKNCNACGSRVLLDHEDPTKGATHYHTKQVKPSWSKNMTVTAVIGNHIFYKD